MKRGRFGLPRPIGVGPLAPGGILFNQPETSEEIKETINDLLSGDISSEVDINNANDLREALALEIFPDSERKRERFVGCLDDWGEGWADASLDATGSNDPSDVERLARGASGCRGMVNSNTLELTEEAKEKLDQIS